MHHIKQVNGTTTILKQVSFSAKAGKSYTLRFSISGSTLSAKVWQTGTTEPSSWMAKASDSTFASGYCGLHMLVENSAVLSGIPVLPSTKRIRNVVP